MVPFMHYFSQLIHVVMVTVVMKHRWCNASVWVHFEMCKVHVQVSNVIILCYAVTVASLWFKIWIK